MPDDDLARQDRRPGVTLLPDEAGLAVAAHCTVHNTLRHEPGISIELDS
jgi:hypothetical protein